MCFKKKVITPITNITQKSVEELVAEKSAGMTPAQKAQYWYELNQSIFALLGKIDVTPTSITPAEWLAAAQTQYPTLTDVKLADSVFYIISMVELTQILTLDWSNVVPYVAEIADCDKFATRLYSHFCDYYKVTSVLPVWGDSSSGYHAFNLAVVKEGTGLIARLIEPQSDAIFVEYGPLGRYTPRAIAAELGIKKLEVLR